MAKRGVLVIILIVLLQACGTSGISKQHPIGGIERATVKGTKPRSGLFDWEYYKLIAVDGDEISYLLRNEFEHATPVDPGRRSLLVHAEFNRKLGGSGPYEVIMAIAANLEANSHYEVTGSVENDEIVIWVTDIETGKLVSERKRRNFRTSPPAPTVPIIVY